MFEDPTGRFQILSQECERVFGILEQSGYTVEGMTESDRTFILAYMADSAINSDGVYSLWFNNHGLLDTPEVAEAFRTIGAPKSASVIQCFVAAVGGVDREVDIEARVEQMELLSRSWPDSDELNEAYPGSGEDIDDLLIDFIKKHRRAESGPRE